MIEYPGKIELLSEFYKFHSDIPRIFMLPIAEVIHNYYDKQRRINYIKVTRMLNKGENGEPEEPIPNLESESESSNPQDDDESNSLITHQETVLPQSLINSLYLKPSAGVPGRKKLALVECSSSRSINGLCGILAGIFKDPLLDVSSFSVGISHHLDSDKTDHFEDFHTHKPSPNGPIILRDSLLLKKKKSPSLINVQNLRLTAEKPDWDNQMRIEGTALVKKDLETLKQTTFLKRKPIDKANAPGIVNKALKRHDSKAFNDQHNKEKRLNPPLEESAAQLKKSYQNLNIHININFNERKKEQILSQKDQLKESKEEIKKEYPKLNLFSLVTKAKKHSVADGVGTTHDTKVNPSEEKTLSSLEFVKVFKKKASEPEPTIKAVKQTFIKKNSKATVGHELPRPVITQAEDVKIQTKELMLLPKKHSVSSSINSIQHAIMVAGKNRIASYKSADRADSATKKNIDIFDKKRKVSLLSNHPSTKSKKDLRSSMKSQKLTSYRHNSSSTKLEPKSSRYGKVSKSAKKNTRKLFMSQDFNQNPQLLGSSPFDAKTQSFNIPLPFQQTLKGNVLNQANILTRSQNKRFALFGPKLSSAKESSIDPFGNLTYRSKKGSVKYTTLNGGGSDLDIAGKRKKQDRNPLKFSEANLHQPDPIITMPKKKRITDVAGAIKHNRVKSDMKTYNKGI